jgi:hypothetical protein
MAAPVFSDFTERLFARLPDTVRNSDEEQSVPDGGYPLKRWIAGIGDVCGSIEDTYNRMMWKLEGEGGAPGDDSDLANPATADSAWLPWISMIRGLTNKRAMDESKRRELLASDTNYKRGTKQSIINAVTPSLTGDRFCEVYDHTSDFAQIGAATVWDLLIVTKAVQTPGGVDPVQLVIDADCKPAGVTVRSAFVTSNWDAIEAVTTTWNIWDGYDWTGIETIGV